VCVVGDDDLTLYQMARKRRGQYTDLRAAILEGYTGPAGGELPLQRGVVAVAREFIKHVVRRLPKEFKGTTAQDVEIGDNAGTARGAAARKAALDDPMIRRVPG
jgi:ATP-dependent DNA helicase UvrD/PcrA